MSAYDIIYKELVLDILENGYSDAKDQVRPVWADGVSAHTITLNNRRIVFKDEVPLLTTKRVAWKTAIHELLWFYVKRTSDVSYLRENKVKIWDEWTRKDGTIGSAYGYQLGKPLQTGIDWLDISEVAQNIPFPMYGDNQVHKLINGLKSNPASRRHVTSLWNIDDLWDMALEPCVWSNQCIVLGGKLDLQVNIRSNDVILGQPFNFFQYSVWQRMLAQVTGLEVGELIFNVNFPHIYDRHIEGVAKQIARTPFPAPKLWINPEIKSIDDFTIYDFILVNPELSDSDLKKMTCKEALDESYYGHHSKIDFEVAI